MPNTHKATESSQSFHATESSADHGDMLSHSLPNRSGRSWSDVFKTTSQKVGLATTMMGAGLGLTGIGGVGSNKAEAGIIISGDPNADQRAIDNGYAYSVEGGGNVGWIAVHSELGTTYSSLVFVNPYTAISDQHKFDARFGINQTYTVGTGSNYNSGLTFTPSAIIKHPNYLGTAGRGVDLTVLKFDVPVPVQQDLVFATGRPALNETVWMAGYGKRGNPVDGYRDQDGAIGAGTSLARLTPPLLGGSSALYQNTIFIDDLSNPTGYRIAFGDSGLGVFNLNREFYGLGIGASLDVTGITSTFLNGSAPEVRTFIEAHSGIASVPEPSSFTLLGGLVGIGAAYRYLTRRSRK